jgi:hypothetical protein
LHFIIIVFPSTKVWDKADEFIPERFDLEGPVPNESNTDFRSEHNLVIYCFYPIHMLIYHLLANVIELCHAPAMSFPGLSHSVEVLGNVLEINLLS